ncbi:Hyaluronan synthase [Chryseobacterium nakagawai]|uniref:Glycosyltransferase family 2 protein n=1 Tax=Chryseobacterium nakagawai TaxID=1241982 RepID=A0AAD0YNW6_CHRNA|nr:glycosyltransferase family A protein [Chryseobacterium nakagawai]AZA91283.1 glycosyltransferase family 2 protein [Chryseobacterium nakagawai]VEH22852.1 Hyaluronan synthase [Chryseobacterium nakagawai]
MITTSIIVPCYNQEKYLSETLDSVLAQTSQNWECIIVNDGSTDHSEKIIDEYCEKDSRFIKLNQHNQGLSASRNNGIKLAKGTLILPLDGDDRIGTHYLELAEKEFAKSPQPKLVYCQAEFFGAKNEFWDLPAYNYEKLLFLNHIFCSAIFKKEDYLKTSGYDTDMKLGYEDWEFWVQLLRKDDIVIQLDSIQFFYRQREDSMVKSLHESKVKRHQMEWHIFTKHRDIYGQMLNSDMSLAEIEHVFNLRQTLKKIKKTFTYKTIYKVERAIRSLF